jgi:hypothetical protein
MHATTFEYLKPTEEQLRTMERLRQAAKTYSNELRPSRNASAGSADSNSGGSCRL